MAPLSRPTSDPAQPAGAPATSYRYDEKRKNIPPAGLAAQGKVEERPNVRYSYDPHLPPALRFDAGGRADGLPELLAEAQRRPLTPAETRLLHEALRNHQPWLEWTGKREKAWFDVDPVALHIHERVSAEAILKVAARQPLQRDLFADPELEYREAVKFYQHEIDWANRLILGDSLLVMNSLAKREDLAGKVQMIYMDPPYGIKFASNFQPFVTQTDVRERESDLTREPEQVKAYRDTWTLGIHSYLAYLRDRLVVARNLLSDTGSLFVQISDENVHRVRTILDEVFGNNNFISLISFRTTSSLGGELLGKSCDYLLWYAKTKDQVKYRQVFLPRGYEDDIGARYTRVQLVDGERRVMTTEERADITLLPSGSKIYRHDNLTSQSGTEKSQFPVDFEGAQFRLGRGHWKTNEAGMNRLRSARRLGAPTQNSLTYVRFLDDFPLSTFSNVWTDTQTGAFTDSKVYVVQTNTKVIERCILMTTDPGDLVLDPTAGSGTTAYVAEQWGRRWITIDTSRVAVALARQRLLTAKFDYYQTEQPDAPLDPDTNKFVYKTVPHITLKSIAQNQGLDPIFARWEPVLAGRLADLNAALSAVTPELRTRLQQKLLAKEKAEGKSSITDADRRRWLLPQPATITGGGQSLAANLAASGPAAAGGDWQEWEVPFDTDPDWPPALQDALTAYRAAWRAKMDAVNAAIAAAAPQETLVDQPQVVRGVVRVSGPFTVEGVQPGEEMLDLDGALPSPVGGEPGDLQTFAPENEPANADAYLSNMIRLLRQDGVRFPNNQQAHFDRLEPIPNSLLHAGGEWQVGGTDRRVAVAFGPQYGPITAKQVEDCLRFAARGGYDDLILAGFTFDAAAQAAIQDDPNPNVRCHMANIRPDVNMGGLLKDTPNSQLFTVFGLPRVDLLRTGEGEYVAHMEGVDIYDPATNTVQATKAEKVAAWFLDSDYDGRTFCITQAFFPDRDAWDKLARALKTVVDAERFTAFSGTRSLPFPAGSFRRVAVKVIDPRGNEVMRVLPLDSGVGEARYV